MEGKSDSVVGKEGKEVGLEKNRGQERERVGRDGYQGGGILCRALT